jgi:hypothetical protein
MTYLEFFRNAQIDDKDPLRRVVDLRPCGERQDEALYFYLNEIIERKMNKGGFLTERRIVFRWDPRANLTDRTVTLLHSLQNRGVPIDPDPKARSAAA